MIEIVRDLVIMIAAISMMISMNNIVEILGAMQ